jgi:hypothetical protein
VSWEPPAEFEWAEVDSPDAIVDVLAADLFAYAGV